MSEAWLSATQARIDAQSTIVAGLLPGSADHRIATSVLLMLQDSLFILTQSKTMVDAALQQKVAAVRGKEVGSASISDRVDPALADTLELLEAFRKVDNPGVPCTVISLAHALRKENRGLADGPELQDMAFVAQRQARPSRSRGPYVVLLVVALLVSAFVLEELDPAPMDVAASVVCRKLDRPAPVQRR